MPATFPQDGDLPLVYRKGFVIHQRAVLPAPDSTSGFPRRVSQRPKCEPRRGLGAVTNIF